MSRVMAAAALALVIAVTGCAPTEPLTTDGTIELTRDGIRLVGTLETPPGVDRPPLVILFHGHGGWRFEPHLTETADRLREVGIASVRFDLTGSGLSDGELGSLSDAASNWIEDARMILADAQRRSDDIHLVGYSLGGLVAAQLAGEVGDEITSVTLLAPAPPYGIRLPVYASAERYAGPVLIIQGDADELVSVQVAERYARSFPRAELVVLPGENHAFGFASGIEAMTVRFIRDHDR